MRMMLGTNHGNLPKCSHNTECVAQDGHAACLHIKRRGDALGQWKHSSPRAGDGKIFFHRKNTLPVFFFLQTKIVSFVKLND